MEDAQQRQLDRFIRVKNFATNNAADAAATDAAQHVAKLSKVIADMEAARTGQKGLSAEAQQALLQGLLMDARDIARTARAVAQEEAGFEKFFPRPLGSGPAAVLLSVDTMLSNLVAAAGDDAATVAAKAARVAKLATHGLGATFHTDLAAHRAQFVGARDDEDSGDNSGVEDTAVIAARVGEGQKECVFLDATFRNLYRRDPGKLAAWTSANNVEDAPKKKKKTPAPPTP